MCEVVSNKQCQAVTRRECHTKYSITKKTVQYGKVDEQICSRVPNEQCKDVSTRKCSSSYEKKCFTTYKKECHPVTKRVCEKGHYH